MTWVSVKDRLPEDDGNGLQRSDTVLACDSYGNIRTAYLQRYEDDEFPARWRLTGPDSYDFEGVTHWQPLPPLPAEEEKHG